MSMPDPTEVLQKTGPDVTPSIPGAVSQVGVAPVNEAQALQNVHSQLANQQIQHAGATVPIVTNHELATGVATPRIISVEAPTDKNITHWWKFMQRKKRQEQGKENQDAA
ncbi:MAG: hypothetical protein Q7K34_03295 [archaeon]|nr:hypothetical protein [archaeon]